MKLWNAAPPGKGCSTPRHPLVEGAAPPGTHFGTLRGVGLRKTTDVLEFSSTLMEQRTLDARGVLFGWFQMLRGILFFRASRQILAQADA